MTNEISDIPSDMRRVYWRLRRWRRSHAGRAPFPDALWAAAGELAAVHEAARRLTSGRGPYPRLRLSQNVPFVPICNAWSLRLRAWTDLDEEQPKPQIDQIESKVLSNRCPPYAMRGGLYDALL